MTITAQTSKTGPYSGNGTTTVFSYTFEVQDEAHLVVDVLGVDGITVTRPVLNVGYTVTGVGNAAGGTIVMTSAPAIGEQLTITRSVPIDQEIDLENRRSVAPEVLEDGFDKLTQIAQDQQEQLDRTIKVDLFETADLDQLVLNINAVAAIESDVSAVAAIDGDVPIVAAIDDKVVIAADNVADITNFADVYLGPAATDPATRTDGSALQAGDLYFNTVSDQMLTYSGSAWVNYEAAAVAAKDAAELAETNAETAEAGAVAARLAAEAAQTGAELAETNAETARDAAFVNADVYADTAAGLAATTTGDQFQVVDGDEIIRYSHDAGPVATEVARYPSADILDRFELTARYAFAVADENRNVAFGVDNLGGLFTDKVSVTEALEVSEPFSVIKAYAYPFAVADADGNVILAVDNLGRLVADFSLVPVPVVPSIAQPENYDYSVNHIFCYGQSLSVGQATPVQSGTAKYDHLMFTRGMRPQYDYPLEVAAQWYASLVPAVEAQSPTQPSLAETPSRGTGDAIKELIEAEDGKAYTDHEYKLLLSNPGFGALTIAQLSKGSAHFSRMVEQATYGLSLANTAGDTYAVQAVTWIQGESDYISNTTQAAYLSSLNTLVSDIQTDLKAVTGQSKRIAVVGYQVATHINYAADDIPDIALAQLECAEANANFFIATPMYHFPYQDGGHLTGPGSQWLGAHLGLAYKRIVIDGEDWSPVRPIALVTQSNIAEVRFHVPKGRLVFDTTTVADQTSKGFQLVDSGGSPLTISNVEIVDFDRVRITAAASIPAGARLRYAWQGNTSRGLGNLRDTQGDTISFDPDGVNYPLHNWCVIFEEEL